MSDDAELWSVKCIDGYVADEPLFLSEAEATEEVDALDYAPMSCGPHVIVKVFG
jgi:hypothetical protein